MRVKTSIAIGLLGVVCPVLAQKAPAHVFVRFNCEELSFRLEPPHPKFTVCERRHFTHEPEWMGPEESPPPLSMTQAARISRGEIKRYADGGLDWRVAGVQLKEFVPKKWVYVVHWRAFDGKTYKTHQLEIPVLLSGRPVEGIDRRSLVGERPAN